MKTVYASALMGHLTTAQQWEIVLQATGVPGPLTESIPTPPIANPHAVNESQILVDSRNVPGSN